MISGRIYQTLAVKGLLDYYKIIFLVITRYIRKKLKKLYIIIVYDLLFLVMFFFLVHFQCYSLMSKCYA